MLRLSRTRLAVFLATLSVLQLPFCGVAAQQNASSAPLVYKETITRSYTTTTVQLPKLCQHPRAKKFCGRISNYFARRFERELIMEHSSKLNFDDPNFSSFAIPPASQQVFLFFLQNKQAPVTTLYALSFQYFTDKAATRMVETFNFDNQSERNLQFNELFADPELAAMLLARFIEKHYAAAGSFMLPVMVTATEFAPRNFIIVDDGLRLFFPPGTVSAEPKQLQSLKVPLEHLAAAGPKSRWWPQLTEESEDK